MENIKKELIKYTNFLDKEWLLSGWDSSKTIEQVIDKYINSLKEPINSEEDKIELQAYKTYIQKLGINETDIYIK